MHAQSLIAIQTTATEPRYSNFAEDRRKWKEDTANFDVEEVKISEKVVIQAKDFRRE